MMAITAGTTGTKISVHDCMVIQAKKKRASGILSHAGYPRIAGFVSADCAASRSSPCLAGLSAAKVCSSDARQHNLPSLSFHAQF